MSRSTKKPPFIAFHVFKAVQQRLQLQSEGNSDWTKPIKTMSRATRILEQMVGMNFAVYNGKKYMPIIVNAEMIGYTLGAFVPTRTFKAHSGQEKLASGKGKTGGKK